MANFISISGVAGSGKTTLAEQLKHYFRNQNYSINDFSFAGPLKDCCALWFGWDRKRLDGDFSYKEGNTLDDGSADPYCERLGMSRRQIMQRMGTECMRQGMHSNFWIILADLGVHLNKIPMSDLYVISDARFRNELDWGRSINAYRILVTRGEIERGETTQTSGASLTTHTNHASETEFLDWDGFDEKIINLINKNQTQQQNMNALIRYIELVTIPAIRHRFDLKGKGKRIAG